MALWNETSDIPKCSGCGSNIYFDTNFQKLSCKSCGSFFDPATLEFAYQFEVPDKAMVSSDDKRIEYTCNSCGAVIVTDDTTSADMCAFCGSPALFKNQLTNEFRPQSIIPFKIDREEAARRFTEWARDFKKAPRDFINGVITKMQGVYVPFWLIDAVCHLDYRERWTGEVERDFDLKKVPFDGSFAIPNALMKAIEPYDYSELVPYSDGYLHGFRAQRYDISAVEMTDIIEKRISAYVNEVYNASVGEDEDYWREDFSCVGDIKQTYALLPVWFIRYEYDGEEYQYAINGQTGEVQGFDVPYSRRHYAKLLVKKYAPFALYTIIRLAIIALFVVLTWMFFSGPSSHYFFLHSKQTNVVLFSIFAPIAWGGLLVHSTYKSLKKHAQKVIRKPTYHIIDKEPDVSEYFDATSVRKAKKIKREMDM